MSIEVPMWCAARLPPCISYLSSRLRNDANSGLSALVYSGWTASSARHLLWNACEHQQYWYFPPVMFAMIKAWAWPFSLGVTDPQGIRTGPTLRSLQTGLVEDTIMSLVITAMNWALSSEFSWIWRGSSVATVGIEITFWIYHSTLAAASSCVILSFELMRMPSYAIKFFLPVF